MKTQKLHFVDNEAELRSGLAYDPVRSFWLFSAARQLCVCYRLYLVCSYFVNIVQL